MIRRVVVGLLVCSWRGHQPWPEGAEDPFCELCGKALGERGSGTDLPPEKKTL